MKTTTIVYRCDNDNKTLSDSEAGGQSHLSIVFGARSGRVSPVIGENPVWKYTAWLQPSIYQFCNTRCLAAWVDRKLAEGNNEVD